MNHSLASTPVLPEHPSAIPPATAMLLAIFERVGRDEALTLEEITRTSSQLIGAAAHGWDLLGTLWEAYSRHWRRFTGSRLDPQFNRLEHPAGYAGSVRVTDGAPVVIVGTGPSLRRAAADLRRVRAGVHLFASPRGADALSEYGLVPDLVLVEHQTPVDAQFSVEDRGHRDRHAITRAPWIAASASTPAALLAGITFERLFVPASFPTWGLWPATALGMAIGSGARAVALVGVDLGTLEWPDPSHRPLRVLLELLAAHAAVPCVDAGEGGAPKACWERDSLDALVPFGPAAPLHVAVQPVDAVDVRYDRLCHLASGLEPLIAHAEATLAAACQVRDGDGSPAAVAALTERWEGLLRAGDCIENRLDVQEGLGASFLPRFWRVPPSDTLGTRLWRPAALAAHEILGQYRTLTRRAGLRGRSV